MNNLSLTTTSIIAVFSGISVSNSLLVQNYELDNPVCYMKTVEGKTINLVNLCGDQDIDETKKVSCKSESEEVQAIDIQISNVNYDGNFLTGKVTNKSCQT
ncbi:MAG: hypothetical protein O4753_04500, partial [Trichodesmium sp. St7_bin2_1]|nr:hypothetical protein [Trichodesmium sp. St7_bin2_1]